LENQHRKITGYRELSQQEIDLINEVKKHGEALEELISKVECDLGIDGYSEPGRWLYIGKTHLQQGIMALVRSIAKPESF
jgi:hypothetical protein